MSICMADPVVDETVYAQSGTGSTADDARLWGVEIEKIGGEL